VALMVPGWPDAVTNQTAASRAREDRQSCVGSPLGGGSRGMVFPLHTESATGDRAEDFRHRWTLAAAVELVDRGYNAARAARIPALAGSVIAAQLHDRSRRG
jgi:hypothetical protein